MALYVSLCHLVVLFSFLLFVNGLRINSPNRMSFRAAHRQVSMAGEAPSLLDSPPMKVGLLVEPTPFGYVSGYKNRFEEMLKFMKKAGDEVMVVTADRDPNPAKEFLGYDILTNRGWEFPLYNQVTLTYDFAGNTPKMIKALKPDVLHASSPSAIIYPAILWAKLTKTPLVLSYHTDLVVYSRAYVPTPPLPLWFGPWLAKFLIKTLHGCADLTLCTSPQLRDNLSAMGLRDSHLSVWQKGINAERFQPTFRDDAMRALMSDNNPEAPLLVYVGRLGAEKRLDRLKTVLDAVPGVRLALVGTGPDEDRLKELYKNYPVVFTGQLTGDALSQAFASADIFAMPSDSETLGFVVLEAMASGVPTVGVAAGGVCDLIEDGSNGFLASNDDNMMEFTVRIKELVTDKEVMLAMGKRARAYAMNWSWEAATSRLRNEQYRLAIENHRASIAHSVISDEDNDILLANADNFMPHLA
jgi:sulfoquinovosyltransferase